MSVRFFGGLLGNYAVGSAVAVMGQVRRLCGTARAAAAGLVLLGPLSVCEPLPSANLTDLVRAGDPAPLVDALARLGPTIDLSSFRQVRAAIDDLQGVSVRRAQGWADGEAAFTRYMLPTGEIVYGRTRATGIS